MTNKINLGGYFENLRGNSEEDVMKLPTKIADSPAVNPSKGKIPDYMKTKVRDFDKLPQEQKTAFFDSIATKLKKLNTGQFEKKERF